MSTAQFANRLQGAEVQYSARCYRDSQGSMIMLVDCLYPQDRGTVISLALDCRLKALTVPNALGARRSNVRVSVTGFTQ